jgi:aminoglycoside/choline kinase family phosphotransferase
MNSNKKHQREMNQLKDNDYFRELLQEIDEYAIQCAGMYYVPYQIQQQSLRENGSFFHDWLVGNYSEFDFSETEDTTIINSEISLFLATQNREEKLHIYRDFMTSYGIIEDLMCLNNDKRLELVTEMACKTN